MFVGAAADYFFGTPRHRGRCRPSPSAPSRSSAPRSAAARADQAAELIDDGWSMLIFPEGGRSPDGWGQPFRGGAAYLALRCDVPVVPVHLEGTGQILRKGTKRTPRPPAPGSPSATRSWPTRASPAPTCNARIEAAVAALADEATTDWWQARRRAHAGTTPSLTGPDAAHLAPGLGPRRHQEPRPPAPQVAQGLIRRPGGIRLGRFRSPSATLPGRPPGPRQRRRAPVTADFRAPGPTRAQQEECPRCGSSTRVASVSWPMRRVGPRAPSWPPRCTAWPASSTGGPPPPTD